ncbi:glycosyltransferase family 2 protein [Paracoccus xiamenensis]|uniref:glycosyltransferase family 2 protein n=1 Tax=Paracoccus xiamenensis TaxID=2714901 RepID=UPI00140A7E3B|nr:glycosyltransferase family 2 protein [Paracoccus xiamenensis]NHF72782.1 hypothetical protein [Paracoccus xiamenensis]
MTWDVVVTAKDTREAIGLFISRYKRMGASRIFIHYDDPDHVHLFDDERIEITVCDADYWAGARPDGLERRQKHNATLARARSGADWIFSCDVDEHLWSEQQVSKLLDAVPEHVLSVSVPPVEAVYTAAPESEDDIVSTPWFKVQERDAAARGTFWTEKLGDLAGLSTAGYWGHTHGKSFTRVRGTPPLAEMPLHNHAGRTPFAPARLPGLWLRHYDCRILDSWRKKHVERIDGTVRTPRMGNERRQIAKLIQRAYAADGEAGLQPIYERMFCLDPATLQLAAEQGFIRRFPPEEGGQELPEEGSCQTGL